jgi:TonB family protein
MSEELKYKIYTSGDCISEQTMYDYIDKKLSAKEEHRVEKHMIDCELCSDALEGLRLTKDRNRINVINEAVRQRTAGSDKKIIGIDLRIIFSAAAGVLLLAGGVFIFNNLVSPKQENIAELKTTPAKDAEPAISSETRPEESSSESAAVVTEEMEPLANAKQKIKIEDAENLKQQNEGLMEGFANTGSGTAISDELSKEEIARPDNDMENQPITTVNSTAITNQVSKNAPAAPADNNSSKDNREKDDAKKTEISTKGESNNNTIVISEKQRLAKNDESKSGKAEDKKKEEAKEAEKKPAAAADNSGYSANEITQDQTIAMDSTPTFTGEMETVYSVVDEVPKFPGGEAEMMKYIRKNLKYPAAYSESAPAGTIYVQFVVEKDGSIKNAKIFKGLPGAPEFDKEVLNLVNNMPKWIPAKSEGKPVNFLFNLPVRINIK